MPSRKRKQAKQIPWFPLAIIAVVVIGGIAFALSGSDSGPDNGVEEADVAVTGEHLPVYDPSAQTDAAVGLKAPTLDGTGVFGESVTIDPVHEGPMAIVLIAHWCPHCQREVAKLQDWLNDNESPVPIRAVSTLVDEGSPNYPPSSWLHSEGWTVPTIADDADSVAAQAFGLRGTPFWVFVDGDAVVTSRQAGELEIDELEPILQGLAR